MIGRHAVPTGEDSLTPSGPNIRRAFDELVSTLHELNLRYTIRAELEAFAPPNEPRREKFEQ